MALIIWPALKLTPCCPFVPQAQSGVTVSQILSGGTTNVLNYDNGAGTLMAVPLTGGAPPKLFLNTGYQLSVIKDLDSRGVVSLAPTIPYPADPSQIHLQNASQALAAQNAVAQLKSYENGLTAEVSLQPSSLSDLGSSLNSAAQSIYDNYVSQGAANAP